MRHILAPRGPALSCRGWGQEAALRMPMNNLDPDVAERPEDLVVYAVDLRAQHHEAYVERSMQSIGRHADAMLALQSRGAVTFDDGNNIRAHAKRAGVENAFDIRGFVPEYMRPLCCEGKGPFRWAALSGDPDDIHNAA